MFYLKINDEIKKLIDLASIPIGCKYYCQLQLIAIDELELLIKHLENNKILKISDEEFKKIKSNAEAVYFNSTHICRTTQNSNNNINNVESETEEDINEIMSKDKIAKKPINHFRAEIDYDLATKRMEEEQKNAVSSSKTENSFSYGLSMLGGLILISLGSYYLGKYVLELRDYYTYVITLIITIIVILAESVLMIIKLHKDSVKSDRLMPNRLKENSFAYKFNAKYRNTHSKGNNFANKNKIKAE